LIPHAVTPACWWRVCTVLALLDVVLISLPRSAALPQVAAGSLQLCWCFLLAPIEMRSRFFVRPYHQKSNYPPMLSCRFIVPWELDFAGEVDSQSLFPFPSPLRIVLRSIVKQEAYCHDLFPSTSFDVRVLKKKMPSDSSLDLGKDQRAKGPV